MPASARCDGYDDDGKKIAASVPTPPDWENTPLRRPGNFTILLAILLALIIVPSFFESSATAGVITTIFLTLMLLAGLSVIRYRKSEFWVACALTGPALVLRWILEFRHERWLLLIAAFFWLALIAFMVVVIVRYVLTERRITYDTISGAICGYLLFGLFNALLFGVFEITHPGSLHAAKGLSVITNGQPDPVKQLIHFIYFSLVTLAGVGYGDITPVSSPARAFAALEAITGQFYIAVLIARLVSIHTSNAAARHSDTSAEDRKKSRRSARR